MPIEEYPYLKIRGEGEKPLSDREYAALIPNQEKIYLALAKEQGLNVDYLKSEFLEKFSERVEENLNETQQTFLKNMIVATGIKEHDEDLSKMSIFVLMAKIGNSQKLAQWSKEETLSLYIGPALLSAAQYSQLSCVQFLIEQYSTLILKEHKGDALAWAAKNGDLLSVNYLIEQCGAVIPDEHKGKAIVLAASKGHKEVMEVLMQVPGIVSPDALEKVTQSNDHNLIHRLALGKVGNEMPAMGNRYRKNGTLLNFGMTKELLLALKEERDQQLKRNAFYYKLLQYLTDITPSKEEKFILGLKIFLDLPSELQFMLMRYINQNPVPYTTREDTNARKAFFEIKENESSKVLQFSSKRRASESDKESEPTSFFFNRMKLN